MARTDFSARTGCREGCGTWTLDAYENVLALLPALLPRREI